MLFYNLLEQDNILERVDAYSIYSFYIGTELEIGRAYSSPLRIKGDEDTIPSFALFYYNGTLIFKDHKLKLSGNVFMFVKCMFNYSSMAQALAKINIDFELGLIGDSEGIIKSDKKPAVYKPRERDKLLMIKVLSKKDYSDKFIKFFMQYGITRKVLELYHVSDVHVITFVYATRRSSRIPTDLTVAYRIANKYKIYYPKTDTQAKGFLTNYPSTFVEGFIQLEYKNDFVIITKAMKEVMFFREHFNWDSVAGKSETTYIPKHIMSLLLKKYKHVLIWLDNDDAGVHAQEEYCAKYSSLLPIRINSKEKDPTDMYKKETDKKRVLIEIKNIVWKTIENKQE